MKIVNSIHRSNLDVCLGGFLRVMELEIGFVRVQITNELNNKNIITFPLFMKKVGMEDSTLCWFDN